jgi:ribosomal protein S18 acetylase RimI-like enzyme
MNPDIVTRTARLDDAQELARLNLAFNEVRSSPEAIARRLADPQRVEQPLVAEIDGRVVGFAALRVVPCVFYEDPHGEVTELYVEEGYRRLGVGRALLALAESMAKAKGVQELVVLTGSTNRKARRLYRSLGYESGDVALSKELTNAE